MNGQATHPPTVRRAAARRIPAVALAPLLAATGFAAGLLTAPPPARACSCIPPPPPAEALAAADVVFRGTVTALVTSPLGVSATLRVRTVWKGPVPPHFAIRTGLDSAGCGYPFRIGADTIVYAHAEAEGDLNGWTTSSCDRTADFSALEAAALGAPLYDRPADDPPLPNCPRCPIPSAAGALESADVVFLGLPLRVTDDWASGAWTRRVRFRVLGVWKGDPPAEVDVEAPYLAWACRGEHWLADSAGALVFAQRTAEGALEVSICGRLDRYAAADAASLGPMTPAPTAAAASPTATVESTATPTSVATSVSTKVSTPSSTPLTTGTAVPPPTATLFMPLAVRLFP